MEVPLSVVTWLPAALGSFQSIAIPTPARSLAQFERCVVQAQLPLMVTVLPFTLALAPVMSGASAAARAGTASVATTARNPPRSRRLNWVDGIRGATSCCKSMDRPYQPNAGLSEMDQGSWVFTTIPSQSSKNLVVGTQGSGACPTRRSPTPIAGPPRRAIPRGASAAAPAPSL